MKFYIVFLCLNNFIPWSMHIYGRIYGPGLFWQVCQVINLSTLNAPVRVNGLLIKLIKWIHCEQRTFGSPVAQWKSAWLETERPQVWASLRCGPWARPIYPNLVLVQPRKARPCLTERLLMGPKESKQTNMDLDTRKPVFRSLQTAKAQTNQRICPVWSGPLLFTYRKVSRLRLATSKISIF